MPQPDEYLAVASGTQTEQTADIMRALETSFNRNRPDLVMVVGDVTSTVAGALVAAKLQIPVAHVEAGLRSFDRRMPEEINRLVTDVVSDYLFVSEPSGLENLRGEGVPESKMFFVGNVMIDSLLRFRERAMQSTIVQQLQLPQNGYALVTLHRPSNVDDPTQLRAIIDLLRDIAAQLPVVFPIHPRTRERLKSAEIATEPLILTSPLGYLDFVKLMIDSRVVLTDSGGIQEETTVLRVPCLTMRENTERPVTIREGTNRLVGTDPAKIKPAIWNILNGPGVAGRIPELWDGKASSRIAGILNQIL